MEMSRDMSMDTWEGNVAAVRVAALIASEILLGLQDRASLDIRVLDAMDWVASIGHTEIHNMMPSAAIYSYLNEKITELQNMTKEERAASYPQAPVDIESWPLVRGPRKFSKKSRRTS